MFAAPFGRMFWKEYRVQRDLWISCLVFGLAIQLLAWWLPVDNEFNVVSLVQIPLTFSFLFAVASGAILFASEREDRTSDWLLALSVPPGPVLVAKLSFAIVATLALQFALAMLSLIIWTIHPIETIIQAKSIQARDIVLTALMPVGLLVIIWSALGSLLVRRVIMAIPAVVALAAITIAINVSVIAWMERHYEPDIVGPIWGDFRYSFALLMLLQFVAILWIGWRWCRGNYLDASFIMAFASAAIDRSTMWLTGKSTRIRIPLTIEREQSWRRTWQRLCWQERKRENLHWGFLGASCLWTIATYAFWDGRMPQPPSGVHSIFVFILPVAMGVLGFRCDAAFSESRFLWNRGVPPEALWLAKQAIWLPRAFWVTGIAGLLSLYCQLSMDSSLEWLAKLNNQSPQSTPTLYILTPWATTVVGYILLCYGCGQLAAILFRRVILAIGAAIMLNIFVAYWMFGVIGFDIPRWWSLGFPAMVTLAVTLWQMRSWMADNRSWSNWWRLVAVFVVSPILMVGMIAFHRAFEVMFSVPTILSSPNFLDALNEASRRHYPSHVRATTQSDDDKFVRIGLEQLCHKLLNEAEPAEWVTDTQTIIRLLDREVIALNPPSFANVTPFSFNDYWKLNSILDRAIKHDSRHLQYDKMIDCCVAKLKLARVYAQCSDINSWVAASHQQGKIFPFLERMAREPSQTTASLQEVILKIDSEIQRFPTFADASYSEYFKNFRRFVLSSKAEFINTMWKRESSANDPFFLSGFANLPWERARFATIQMISAVIDYQEYQELEHPKFRISSTVDPIITEFSVQRAAIEPFRRTTYDPSIGTMPPLTDISRVMSDWKPLKARETEVYTPLANLKKLVETRCDTK